MKRNFRCNRIFGMPYNEIVLRHVKGWIYVGNIESWSAPRIELEYFLYGKREQAIKIFHIGNENFGQHKTETVSFRETRTLVISIGIEVENNARKCNFLYTVNKTSPFTPQTWMKIANFLYISPVCTVVLYRLYVCNDIRNG